MAVSYKKLLHLMIEKDITNANLMKEANISANIIKKISNAPTISFQIIRYSAASSVLSKTAVKTTPLQEISLSYSITWFSFAPSPSDVLYNTSSARFSVNSADFGNTFILSNEKISGAQLT